MKNKYDSYIESRNLASSKISNSNVQYTPLVKHAQTKNISDALIIDTIINNSQNTIYFKDTNSKFILKSKSLEAQFGITSETDIIGQTDFDFFPADLAQQKRNDEIEVMESRVPILNKLEYGLNKEGERIVLTTCKYPLYDYDGKVIGTWGTSQDITKLVIAELKLAEANEKLQELSLVDELTGLFNRRHFFKSLELTISIYNKKRCESCVSEFCLVFIDLDNFKVINDTYGHVVGDAVLQFVSHKMKDSIRESDIIFRYGGDEFVIIVHNSNLSEGIEVAENLRSIAEENPYKIGDEKIPLTISLGVAEFDGETTVSDLIHKADTKLYQAKKDGKNIVR